MSLFKMKRGQESKVSSLAKEDGSLIFSLNGANDSTVRLDQSVNGTVQRLGIAVDKAKDSNAVIDYNDPNRRIQIGYANAGLTTSNLTHVAGYTNDGKQIKDVSKDVLKSWLGVSDSDLGSYQKRYRNANAITTGGTDLNGTLPPAIFAYKNGYPLHTDPEFANSNNGIYIYNNTYNGNVTIERIAMENGNSSGYVLKVSNKGSASPGLGGWYFGDTTVHARQYTCIFRAKIPAGRNVQWASNAIGTNGTSFWLTEHAGTGKWEWYAYHVDCGSANFSSTNFFYIDGAVGTASAPVVWYLSYANTIVNSYGNYDGLRTRYADTASNSANSSSAIFSTYSAYPQGFQSRTTSATWGNTTGTFITGWHTSSGGDVAFMNDNPSSGKVSMKLDGYFYQNEGANRVLDTSDAANYVKKSGDTMTGLLTLKTSNQQGIKLGSAWMTAASDTNGEFVLQGGHLRFGGSAWDYNQWAGLKYDHNKKYIYLGLADNTIFTANSAQSGGSLLTPGISNIYVGGTTQTRVITSSDIDGYVKKSGDTMTGALNFANGTWNKVGDDVKIGDHNIAGSLGVIGANGQTRIDWCQYNNASKYQGIVYDGTKLATSGTFKADYFDGVAKDSQALAGSTLAQIIEAAGGVITITKNLKPTVDWLDTGIAGTALSTGTYIVQVSGLSSGNTPGIYSEIWSGVFSWYSGGTNSTNSDEILLHNAGHADNSNELYLRTIRQGATSGGVMKLQMAVKQASTSTVDVTFKFRKMI